MKRPLGLLALALSLACGSSSGSGPSQTNCDRSSPDAGPSNPADLQSMLTFQGRHDSGLEAFFGSASADIFAQADQLMAGASQDAAGQLGVTAGDPQLPSGSCGSALRSGLDAGSIHTIYRDMPLNLALSTLLAFIKDIPVPTLPTVVAGSRVTSSGDPSIKSKIDVRVNGDGKSKIIVEAASALTINSTTLGSVLESSLVHIELDVCPDASGKVRGKASLTLHGNSLPASGANGVLYELKVDNDFVYALDGSAEITSLQITGGGTYHSTGDQTNNMEAQASQTSDIKLTGANPTVNVTHEDGSAQAATLLGKNLLKPGDYVAATAASEARKKWRDGTCVEIKVDPETTSVRPGQKLHLTASVRQKFDQSDLQVPVVATLEGSGVLKPGSDPMQAPAGYDYLPGNAGDRGDLTFTSTSRRGIGKKTLTLTACTMCGWKGTVTIEASGAVDVSLDGGNYTGSDHIGVTYNGSFSVESDAQGNQHAVDGSVEGSYTHTMQKSGSGKTEHCDWTSNEATNGSATGSATVMPGDGSGSVSAFDGQFQISFSGPSATVEGTEELQESGTNVSDDGMTKCAPPDPKTMTTPLHGDFRIYMTGSGTYDQANPALTGSSTTAATAGGQTLFGVPVAVHATWSLH